MERQSVPHESERPQEYWEAHRDLINRHVQKVRELVDQLNEEEIELARRYPEDTDAQGFLARTQPPDTQEVVETEPDVPTRYME